MRIRVRIDASQPLKINKKIKKAGGEAMLVHFKYERLGVFCFLCGVIGHIEQHCAKLFELDHDDGSRNWGPELRVENRRNGGGAACKWLVERGGGRSESQRAPLQTDSGAGGAFNGSR